MFVYTGIDAITGESTRFSTYAIIAHPSAIAKFASSETPRRDTSSTSLMSELTDSVRQPPPMTSTRGYVLFVLMVLHVLLFSSFSLSSSFFVVIVASPFVMLDSSCFASVTLSALAELVAPSTVQEVT